MGTKQITYISKHWAFVYFSCPKNCKKSSEISGFKGLFLCIPVLPQKQKIIHPSLHLVDLLRIAR